MDKNNVSNYPEKLNITGLHGGLKVTFYCSSCDMNVTKEIYNQKNVEQALTEAWKEARKYFNRCHECGAWVCDGHYNENVLKCLFCQPK